MPAPKGKATADAVDEIETPSQTDQIASALARLVHASEEGPIKQTHIGRAIIPTAVNPSGSRTRPRLTRACRMNGSMLRDRLLTNDEITLLNQLKPGKYHGNKWIVMQTDGEDDGSKIDIFIPNKTQTDRLETKQASGDGTLGGILKQIVAEAATRA